MKKLLLLFTMLAMFTGVHAQQYDELDLSGGWELVSCTGEYPPFTSFHYRSFTPSDAKYLYLGSTSEGVSLPGVDIKNMSTFYSNEYYNGLFYNPEIKDMYDENNSVLVIDYFISDGNKLHLPVYYYGQARVALRFIIESLTDEELRIKSFDGNCLAVYKRIAGDVSVNEISTQDAATEYYNINGIRQSEPTSGLYIEKQGQNIAKRVVR